MQAHRLFLWFRRSLPARLVLFALLFITAVAGVHVLALDRLVHVEAVSGEVRNRWLDSISVLYGVGRRLSDLRAAEADVVLIADPARRKKQAADLPSVGDTRYVRVPKKQPWRLGQGLPSARCIRVTWPGVAGCSGPAAGSAPHTRRPPDRRSSSHGGACCRRGPRSCAPLR